MLRTYLLPFPPSVNHYWKNGRRFRANGTPYLGRVLTPKADKFRADAIAAIARQNNNRYPRPINGRLDVEVTLFWPTLRACDGDNYIKGLFDAMTHARVWNDDVQVRRHIVRDGEVMKGGAVLITINVLPENDQPMSFPEEFRHLLQPL